MYFKRVLIYQLEQVMLIARGGQQGWSDKGKEIEAGLIVEKAQAVRTPYKQMRSIVAPRPCCTTLAASCETFNTRFAEY
jgi:hypothetical protein